jgi:hypothetical protein
MRSFIIGAVALAMAVAPSFADETWNTELGEIAWEKDYDGGAVFLLKLPDNKVVRFYVEGLKADDESRGNYKGYWISTLDEQICSATLTGPDGTRSRTWGHFSLNFMKPSFPSDWSLLAGDCMGELTDLVPAFTTAE